MLAQRKFLNLFREELYYDIAPHLFRAVNCLMVKQLLTFSVASHEDADKPRAFAALNYLSDHYRASPFFFVLSSFSILNPFFAGRLKVKG